MPSLKDLRVRIRSVKSTQKITSAMKMVAASRLRRAQEQAEAARPYAQRMERMLNSLAGKMAGMPGAPPLLAGTGRDAVHLMIVASSDRGLAGGFNGTILREARRQIRRAAGRGQDRQDPDGRPQGPRFAAARLRQADRREPDRYRAQARRVQRSQDDLREGPRDVRRGRLRYLHDRLQPLQIGDDPDRDGAAARPVRRLPAQEAETGASGVYEFEPDEEEILKALLPNNLAMQIFTALLENVASEQGARMTAMDNATRNAGEMIDRLTINYNRTRQAVITKELIEIISGAEAL